MSKKIAITTSRGFLMSGAALGELRDRRLEPGDVTEVPQAYGEHLIADGFAERAPEKPKGKKVSDRQAPKLEAKKGDDGLFTILRGSDPVVSGLTEADAEAFEGLDDAGREKFVADRNT